MLSLGEEGQRHAVGLDPEASLRPLGIGQRKRLEHRIEKRGRLWTVEMGKALVCRM